MGELMTAKGFVGAAGFLVFMIAGGLLGTASAQYSFSGDAAVVSKYIWRGQRLTNDWSLQPAMTVGYGGFAFNAWGTMDLAAVNPGTAFADLQGRFSEIDYTFSYDHSLENVSVGGGVIFYTFPDRFNTTTEIYGTVGFDSVPLAPSATVYVDVDETTAGGGTAGVYILFGAGHSFETGSDIFTGLDLSGTFALATDGFTNFYYGSTVGGGPHDASFTVSAPITINDNWSAGAFVTYSGLIGEDIRESQFQDPREPARPTGATYADTVWGGMSVSLTF